jgi:type VI secretion system protein
MAVTLRFQSSGRIPGRADSIRMRGRSMTLGRSPQNDVVLPDPDQLISKAHCVLEDHGGRIVVLDLSSNGTFLNYGKVPLGRNPTPLNDGDVLSIGLYELVVGISDVDVPDPMDLPPLGQPDMPLPPLGEVADAGPARPALQGDPLGDDVDFLDALLGDAPPSGPSRVQRPDLADDGPLAPLAGGLLDAGFGGAPHGHTGASRADHSDPMSDSFRPQASRDVIPDDWGLDDLMPGAAPPPPPPPRPAPRVADAPPALPPGRDPFAEPAPPPRPPRAAPVHDHAPRA